MNGVPGRRLAGRPSGERGTSLLEVMMVSVLMLVVMGSLLGVFDGFTRAEKGIEQRLDAESELRSAMAEVTRDLRAADPLVAAPASSDMATAVSFVFPAAEGGSPAVVRFRVDEGDGQLLREVLDGVGGKVTVSRLLMEGIPMADDPMFTYFDQSGAEMVPGVASVKEIASCTARVDVSLVRQVGGDDGVTRQRESSVALRNRPSGSAPC